MPDERNLAATAILDFGDRGLAALACELRAACPVDRDLVRAAHAEITHRVRPVYSLDELQPASLTLRKGKGSCSQRIAVLEALARAGGIATRVHVLWVAGRFWYPRFAPLFAIFIPRRILLVWPEFWMEGKWLGLEEIYGTLDQLAGLGSEAFSNDGESLFDAVTRTPVDFRGRTCAGCGGKYDLSQFVVGDGGTFASRDDVFRLHRPFQRTVRGWAFERVFGGHKSS
jgi:transglutaminase-like putative cysteine protease